MKTEKLLSLCLMSLLWATTVYAQTSAGRFTGRVVNLQGNGIADVKVTAALSCEIISYPMIFPPPTYSVSQIQNTNTAGEFDITGLIIPPVIISQCRAVMFTSQAEKPGFTFSRHFLNRSQYEIRGNDQPSFTSVSAAGFSKLLSTGQLSHPPLASESIAAGFGAQLATTTAAALTVPLPTSLAGRSVVIKDANGIEQLASLLFVSPNQINYILPANLANDVATVLVKADGVTIAAGFQEITRGAPGIFTVSANGAGAPAAAITRVKANGTFTREPVARYDETEKRYIATPIDLGAPDDTLYLTLYGTGWRTSPGGAAETLATLTTPAKPNEPAYYCPVLYAGAQPSFAGLDQMNLLLPRELSGKGALDLRVSNKFNNVTSNPVQLIFK